MTITDDTPATVTNDRLQSEQVCFHLDARDTVDDDRSFASDDNYTDGTAALLSVESNFLEYEFTPQHDISAANFGFQFRIDALDTDTHQLRLTVNDERIHENTSISVDSGVLSGLDWYEMSFFTANRGVDLTAGETATLLIEVVSQEGGAQTVIDRVAPYDNRYESELNFDNTVDSNEQLSGPELFANEIPIELSQTETRRDVTEANIESTWDDTSNGQYIELRIGDDDFTRANNSETASTTGGPARSIDVTLGLSRHGTRTDDTPTEGFLGQSVDTYELFANPAAVFSNSLGTAEVDAVIPPGSITGDRVEESGQLASDDSLLTRSVLAPFDVFENMEIRSSEKVGFDND